MARVQYTGAPQSEAPESPPGNYGDNIRATPDQFGGLIAEGANQAFQGGMDLLKFHNQVASDNATNNYLTESTKILYGDPSGKQVSTDASGQPIYDGGFFSKRGADALTAWPEVQTQLQELRQSQREGLAPTAALQYDTETRRYFANSLRDAGSFNDQQRRSWAKETNATTIQQQANILGRAPNDPKALDTDPQSGSPASKIVQAYVRNAQMEYGNDPTVAEGAALQAKQYLLTLRVRAMLPTDPLGARKLMNDNVGLLSSDPDYDRMSFYVDEKATGALSHQLASIITGGGVPGGTTNGAASSGAGVGIKTALLGQESGFNPNAPPSVTGARGEGQVEPATFKRFAKPGEHIDAKADNVAVSGRYADYLSALPNVQGGPARIAVGYFSGEKNISPPGSQTPWLVDKADPTGKKTSSYVADVMKRMGGGGGGAGQTDPVQSFLQNVPPDLRDEVEARARTEAERNSAGARIGLKHTFDNVEAEVDAGRMPSVWPTQGQIAAAFPADPDMASAYTQELSDLQTIAPKLADLPHMSLAQINALDTQLKPKAQAGEADFARENRLYQRWGKSVDGYIGRLARDPAGTMFEGHPDLVQGWQNVLADQRHMDGYARSTLSAQAATGIPDGQRWVLPRGFAKQTVDGLTTAPAPQAVATMKKLETDSGNFAWPYVYRDLARAGLPPSYQALAIAAPQDATIMANAIQKSVEGGGKNTIEDSLAGYKTAAGKTYVQAIDTELASNQGLNDFGRSWGVAGRAGADIFSGVRGAVRDTAMYLSATTGMDPKAAADRASAMIAGRYNFVAQPGHPPARLDKSIAPQDFRDATSARLGMLKDADLVPYRNEGDEGRDVITATPEQLRQHTLQGAQNAYWVAVPGPDGNGAVRAVDPQNNAPVLMTKGTTKINLPDGRSGFALEMPFARIPGLAASRRATISKAEDANVKAQEAEAMAK